MDSGLIIALIGWSVTSLGWLLTHVLSLRTQNRNFLHQVLNAARLDLVRAIRDYQMWLLDAKGSFFRLELELLSERTTGYWLTVADELRPLYWQKENLDWIYRLEEHEILFPETRVCRVQLLERHKIMQGLLTELLSNLISGGDAARRNAIMQTKERGEAFVDQIAVLEDLRVHLQNRCLSSFTGHKIPSRLPKEAKLPKLVMNKSNQLEIV